MKTSILYPIYLLLLLIVSFPAEAQQLSPTETNEHADMVVRKERHRERLRADKKEKRMTKAEKRLETKAKYKKRRKSKIKQERT